MLIWKVGTIEWLIQLKFQCLIIIELTFIIVIVVVIIAAVTIGKTDLFEPYRLLEDSVRLVWN
jgi:hypothetical protein